MSRRSEITNTIDKMVGQKIHELRLSMGLSRGELARKIGVTHQQVQKYEKATNRVSSGRLKVIANALGETTSFFFGDEKPEPLPERCRIVQEMTRNLFKIKDSGHLEGLNILIRNMGK